MDVATENGIDTNAGIPDHISKKRQLDEDEMPGGDRDHLCDK